MQYLDLFPDPDKASCMSVWNRSFTASYLSDNAEWHHMAVTWTKADNGRMRIFKDGLMMSEVRPSAGLISSCAILGSLFVHSRILQLPCLGRYLGSSHLGPSFNLCGCRSWERLIAPYQHQSVCSVSWLSRLYTELAVPET